MTTTNWTNELLEAYRFQTDPLADQTIQTIMESGQVQTANHFLRELIENEDFPVDAPQVLKDYIQKTQKLPTWANPELIKEAEKLFALYGGELSMMLLCKSLPASYTCWRGAKVLAMTGRLAEHRGSIKQFTRRLMETSQFVINVMAGGGFLENGKAIRTAQKVRLMHASIRYFLKNTPQQAWDTATYGEPINQEDMAGTLMSFCAYPIEGVEQLGIQLSTFQKDAFVHAWNVIGYIMGVDEKLMPKNYIEASALGHQILEHQKGESEDGKVLTKACLDFLKHITVGNVFDVFPDVLVRYLLGNELADIVGVPKYALQNVLQGMVLRVFDKYEDAKDDSAVIRKLSERFKIKLLQGMVNYFNEEKQVQFQIPPSLQANWTQEPLQITWKDVASSPNLAGFRVSIQRKKKG